MYLNDFSVRVNGKSENSGYVEMNHGETYAIVLKNNKNVRCDATVEIDGKDVGTFRIAAHSNLYLERPANEQKLFTFYQLGTSEAEKSGLDKVEKNEMGLIKVTFKPEKLQPVKTVIKEVHHYHNQWWNPWTTTITCSDNTAYSGKYLGRGLTTASTDSLQGTLSCDKELTYDLNALRDDDAECFCASDTKCAANYSEKMSRSRSAVGTSSALRSASFNDSEPRAGGTGLSGHSNQRFITVADLDYDEERITEIFLRLIPVKERRSDPVELKPVVKSTPIPPPLFVLV